MKERFVDKYTGGAMAIAVARGVLLVGALFWAYASRCWGTLSGECKALRESPPWIPLAALLSAPATLLSWYWRTDHKKRDIEHVERDLRFKEDERRGADAREWRERFAASVKLLADGATGALYALEAVARDAPKRDYWTVIETICGYARLVGHDRKSPGIFRSDILAAQTAMKVLGRRDATRDPKGRALVLSGAQLHGVVFREGNLDGANLTNADLGNADFAERASSVPPSTV